VAYGAADTIGSVRIVKTGATYNLYFYGFNADFSATAFAAMQLKPDIPSAYRPNDAYAGECKEHDGMFCYGTWYYNASTFRVSHVLDTGYSGGLKGLNIGYTR
jgi:hypothetical protein